METDLNVVNRLLLIIKNTKLSEITREKMIRDYLRYKNPSNDWVYIFIEVWPVVLLHQLLLIKQSLLELIYQPFNQIDKYVIKQLCFIKND